MGDLRDGCRLGSLAGAARALGLANPPVSKAIARLEARLGFALARTSRRLALTEAGRTALQRAAHILREGEALEDSSLLSRRLCTVRILLVGAPTYFMAHGRPTHPAQLTDHVALASTGGRTPGV